VFEHDWIWGKIPEGFEKISDGQKHRMVVRQDMEMAIRFDMCAATGQVAEPSQFQGRTTLSVVRLPHGETALIRAYHHGGVFRNVLGSIFFNWPARPFRELAITEEVRRRGVPTVEVFGACIERIFGPFYRGWLITRELQGALDLWRAFQGATFTEKGSEQMLRPVAQTLKALHREGVYHRDLNLKNILVRVEGEAIKAYIIDFDRATLFLGEVPKQIAQRNLDRLLRSVRKLDPARKYFTRRDWELFVNWYHEVDHHEC